MAIPRIGVKLGGCGISLLKASNNIITNPVIKWLLSFISHFITFNNQKVYPKLKNRFLPGNGYTLDNP